jgi:hypothetical protein
MQALNCAAMRPCATARVSAFRPKSALVRAPGADRPAPSAGGSPGSGAIGLRHSRALPRPPSPPAPAQKPTPAFKARAALPIALGAAKPSRGALNVRSAAADAYAASTLDPLET